MTYRVRNIGIAVALAVVAALLTSFYVTNYKRHVQRGEDHVTVLVAKRDIPVGTAGSDVAGMMAPTQVPRRSVVPGSISSPGEVKDLVSTQETFAGEQVTAQRFSSVSQTGVEGQRSRGRHEPAARGDAQGRRPRRLRRGAEGSGLAGDLPQPRHDSRPEGPAGAAARVDRK